MRVALDTSILIPLLQAGELNSHDQAVKDRMLGVLADSKVHVVIPASALAELAANPRLSEEQRASIVSSTASRFEIAAFDARAVVRAAPLLARLASRTGENKQCLKVDALIVASSISVNCDVLYSTDPHLAAIAEDDIPVREPPTVVREQQLDFT